MPMKARYRIIKPINQMDIRRILCSWLDWDYCSTGGVDMSGALQRICLSFPGIITC